MCSFLNLMKVKKWGAILCGINYRIRSCWVSLYKPLVLLFSCFQTCTPTLNLSRQYPGVLYVRREMSKAVCQNIQLSLSHQLRSTESD